MKKVCQSTAVQTFVSYIYYIHIMISHIQVISNSSYTILLTLFYFISFDNCCKSIMTLQRNWIFFCHRLMCSNTLHIHSSVLTWPLHRTAHRAITFLSTRYMTSICLLKSLPKTFTRSTFNFWYTHIINLELSDVYIRKGPFIDFPKQVSMFWFWCVVLKLQVKVNISIN